ncbi:hypothetical protein [Ruegeria sp.]|uniref:hypothetical protein n=1 Tax=Ruegeria sp. TaxID=1879320 RepID=UPI003B5AF339
MNYVFLASGSLQVANGKSEPWRVTLVDTGKCSLTGGRFKQVMPRLKDEEAFCLTHGDEVGNIDIRVYSTLATVPSLRCFGKLEVQDNQVLNFSEQPVGDSGLINGGFFVDQPHLSGSI